MKNRIFISFAIEDSTLRDFLVGQSKNEATPIEFTDMSVKQAWDDNWKTNCRTKIKGCAGVIAIITSNSKAASGQQWEIQCAKQENIPIIGIWGHQDDHPWLTVSDLGIRVMDWTWHNVSEWIKAL